MGASLSESSMGACTLPRACEALVEGGAEGGAEGGSLPRRGTPVRGRGRHLAKGAGSTPLGTNHLRIALSQRAPSAFASSFSEYGHDRYLMPAGNQRMKG